MVGPGALSEGVAGRSLVYDVTASRYHIVPSSTCSGGGELSINHLKTRTRFSATVGVAAEELAR